MKQLVTLILFSVILYSCKKEISTSKEGSYLQTVKMSLRDSLNNADYSDLDFSNALLDKIDSLQLFYLRIPFRDKALRTDFVLLQTTAAGKIKKGKIVHLEGEESSYGDGKIKRKKFDGSIIISSLDRKTRFNSSIDNGFITALHQNKNTRDLVYATDVLPEVVVVAFVRGSSISFSTWMLLQSLFYDSGTGGGTYSSFYGSADAGSLDYTSGGTGDASVGSVDATFSSVTIDPVMAVDVDTYADKDPIDIDQYLKCFDNIPDDGAVCSIEIFSDIPVDADPNKLFNWNTESPGHCFIQLKKSNGAQFVQQSIGFYPKANWKNILSADPVDSKIVDDGGHEFNASLKMNLSPFLLRSAIGKIKTLASMKYDMDEFNCTDFSLEVFNYVRTPLLIPQYVIPGGIFNTNTPQGLYNKLTQMKYNNDPEAQNITVGIIKGYVGESSGPCN